MELHTERVLSLDELQERGQFDAIVIATGAAMASLPEAAATALRTLSLVRGQVSSEQASSEGWKVGQGS